MMSLLRSSVSRSNKTRGRISVLLGQHARLTNGMQSQVLASLSAKNNVLAHAAAAEAGASTMNNKQHQRDRKRNLLKEFVDEIGRGSFGKAEEKEQIKKYKKKKGKDGAPTDDKIASLNLILRNHSSRVLLNVRNVLQILNVSMSSKGNC
jgi:serine/threonine protein kinase HipA of HipAB toxin-antitoxin module